MAMNFSPFGGGWPAPRQPKTATSLKSANLAATQSSVASLVNPLPLLPGYNFDGLSRPGTHAKRAACVVRNGNKMVDDHEPRAPELTTAQQQVSVGILQSADDPMLRHDKQILKFVAYYKEAVHESALENYRVRACHIYYYLEDDTVQVTEPKVPNSGLMQGNVVARHKISPHDGPLTIHDFGIGKEVTIYGKRFHIVDCDSFTRYYYSQLGMSLGPREEMPTDPHYDVRQEQKRSTMPRKAKTTAEFEAKRYAEFAAGGRINLPTFTEIQGARDFYENDRNVLRFHGVWDNRNKLYGDYRLFTLLYFLADNTLKVIEMYPPNSGRDPFPVFLKRAKCPKTPNPQSDSNLETLTKRPQEFITQSDLAIGATVSICGREILLYDCDDFTKEYYHKTFGIEEFHPIDISLPQPEHPVAVPPPHQGFGSEEDSLGSWKYLVLKAPKKDVKKMQDLDGKMLRFGGHLVRSPERRFILVYYLADDTIGIYEQAGRNTGHVGGKFLGRSKVKQPIPGNATLRLEAPYYGPSDFYVGAQVNINGHEILLDTTDEHTTRIIENIGKDFDMEEVNRMLQLLRRCILTRHTRTTDAFRAFDLDHNGYITLDELSQVCVNNNIQITTDELGSLMSYLDQNADGVVDFNEFVSQMFPKDYASELDSDGTTVITESVAVPLHSTLSTVIADEAAAERILRVFRDKLELRRSVFLDTFRVMSDRSPDSLIGEKEFRYAIVDLMQMNLTEEQLNVLITRFFSHRSRLSLKDFYKLMQPHTNFLPK
eukprot:TRINITY_DN1813_c0_g1_i1.p1 TRINITY_DN1813_c0_g1~~TRINITY_DN1813_c0_g1_i1.p1  ORF type:complete len:770 (-),score=142.70 TRINITY_DN1813_c0_g1_i1:47-2356(-)